MKKNPGSGWGCRADNFSQAEKWAANKFEKHWVTLESSLTENSFQNFSLLKHRRKKQVPFSMAVEYGTHA